MTRVHEPTLTVLMRKEGNEWVLRSPAPGWYVPSPIIAVARGATIGELEVLGRRIRLVAGPDGTGLPRGNIEHLTPRVVAYGDVLLQLDTAASLQQLGDVLVRGNEEAAESPAAAGLVFRAPTSGRFYGRATPEKPPFVAVGDELGQGATVCLLEVMKTFHRVTYGGPGLPERARVRAILIADGADVTAGEPLLALET